MEHNYVVAVRLLGDTHWTLHNDPEGEPGSRLAFGELRCIVWKGKYGLFFGGRLYSRCAS